MADEQEDRFQSGQPPQAPSTADGSAGHEDGVPDIALWRPSLPATFLSGMVAGALLGAADGVLCHLIVGGFASAPEAALWGAALGLGGGVLLVAVRRVVWGPEVGVEVGTVLGLLYGIAPGLAVLYHIIFVRGFAMVWYLGALVMACSMAGLLIGGALDRVSEAIVARTRREPPSRDHPGGTP